jgi:hypothetical protein
MSAWHGPGPDEPQSDTESEMTRRCRATRSDSEMWRRDGRATSAHAVHAIRDRTSQIDSEGQNGCSHTEPTREKSRPVETVVKTPRRDESFKHARPAQPSVAPIRAPKRRGWIRTPKQLGSRAVTARAARAAVDRLAAGRPGGGAAGAAGPCAPARGGAARRGGMRWVRRRGRRGGGPGEAGPAECGSASVERGCGGFV